MILVPNDSWQWNYDEKTDSLVLDLSDRMQFTTAFRSKQLTSQAKCSRQFTLDDASHYYHLLECIGELPFSEAERVQIVLNAIAVIRFAKPQMPQSWYFREFNLLHEAPLFGEVVTLVCESGHRDFLVIEPGDNASICLLLEGTMQLAEDKVLSAHSFIKVMNNRIIPFHAVSNQLLRLA